MDVKEKQPRKEHRAKVMSPDIQRLITARAGRVLYYTDDGKIITDRQVIAEKLMAEIKEKFPNEDTPSFETLIHMVSRARSQEPGPLEGPWGTNTLKDYPLPADTVAKVVEVNKYASQKKLKFSIRQALWVSRLCQVVPKIEDLYTISLDYALVELMCEQTDPKVPFDSKELDMALPDVVEVVKVFEKLLNVPAHFKETQEVYGTLTGFTLQGITILVNKLYLKSNQLYPVVLREQVGLPVSGDVILTKSIGNAKDILPKLKLSKGEIKKILSKNQGFMDIPIPLALNVSGPELQQIKEDHKKYQNEGIEYTQRQ